MRLARTVKISIKEPGGKEDWFSFASEFELESSDLGLKNIESSPREASEVLSYEVDFQLLKSLRELNRSELAILLETMVNSLKQRKALVDSVREKFK